jgi:histidyl-tRNA synthetase
MSDRIDSRAPSGFRDYLPADTMARQAMMDRIKTVFEQFVFLPIDTPALEREEVLTGGDAGFSKQLYRARITDDDEPLALRFDLTVPLARYVSAHADDLQFPFLRYHIGNVWRGEHAQAGRFRQFIQADADIVGATSITADAQVLALATETLDALGLDSAYTLRFSNRKVLEGLVTFLGLDAAQTPAVLRAIDKLDKHGWATVARELADKVGLDAQQIDGIQEFLALKGDTPEQLLDAAEAMLKFSDTAAEGVSQLRETVRHLDAMDVPRATWTLDLSIARGLGYYTGTVFETTLNALPQYGSICSGGRYDALVSRFSPLQLSGVGMSIGLDRLFAALDELGLVRTPTTTAKVAVLDFEPSAHDRVLSLAAELRRMGISAALYLGGDNSLKAQLAWAVKAGYPFVVLMGASELERGVVQLKNMQERTQDEVLVGQVAERLTS